MSGTMYFGVWGQAGHYLFHPGGRLVYGDDRGVVYYGHGGRRHLDGTLAPRARKGSGGLVWTGAFPPDDHVEYYSDEYPQGQYLHHVLDNGYSAIQWWDRCQGDRRGGCNSTVLLLGVHDAQTVEAAARECFPEVIARLRAGGFELVSVVGPSARREGLGE